VDGGEGKRWDGRLERANKRERRVRIEGEGREGVGKCWKRGRGRDGGRGGERGSSGGKWVRRRVRGE